MENILRNGYKYQYQENQYLGALIRHLGLLILGMVLIIGNVSVAQSIEQKGNDSTVVSSLAREGLFFSFGLGGSIVSASPSSEAEFPRETGSGWTNLGAAISFKIGYGINTHWIIYYQSLVNLVTESTLENEWTPLRNSLFSYGLSGVGATYFINKTSPSHYFNASVGLTNRTDTEVKWWDIPESGNGLGFSIGTGYQFADRWSVEANLIYGNVKGKPIYDDPWKSQFWSTQVSINYVWFKSFKKNRWKRLGKMQVVPQSIGINQANLSKYYKKGDKVKVSTNKGKIHLFTIQSFEATFLEGINIRVSYSVIETVEFIN
jgi:hypothetical protein